jgi:signal transduction histidine kinase
VRLIPAPRESPRESPRGSPRGRVPGDAVALLLVLNLAVAGAGWLYLRSHAAKVREEHREQLEAIATLKASEVDTWRSERLTDAWAFFENTVLSEALIRFMGEPGSARRRAEVEPILEMVIRRVQYRTVTLLDAAGAPLLSFPPAAAPLGADALAAAADLARGKTPGLSDPLQDSDGTIVVLAVAPVLAASSGARAGAVVLAMDPRVSLYPAIAGWPVPSETSEALLVRGQGGRIRFLSPARFHPGAGLFDLGVDELQSLVSAKALRGLQGPVEGRDYRGETVFATIRKVSGTGWYLIVKVDRAEVEAETRLVSWLVMVGTVTVALLLSAWALARWTRQAGRFRAEQARLRARLDKAREMESVALLAAGVAHDFNNILAGISGTAEVIRALSAEPESREQSARIIAATRRAAATVQGLLAFAEQQDLRRKPVELNGLVRAQENALAAILGPAVALRIRPAPTETWVRGDPDLLADVLTHLAGNARGAMPKGGTVTVELEAVEEAPGQAAPGAAGSGGVRLRVTDTGVGMTEETRQRIFEPFYSPGGFGATPGVGLAAVSGIVRQHGGTIEVESAPGRGAVFTIVLPREPGPARAAEAGFGRHEA